MEEKILNTRKNGMAMLLLTLLGYVVARKFQRRSCIAVPYHSPS